MDKTSAGSVTRTITYYPVAGAMRINGTMYYTLKDHLGSASVVTDTSGTVVGEQRYYPFGETRLTTGTIFTDKLFTGQREMAGLGIYHYGARFYSPKLGRFLSADSIVPSYANPQAHNRYSYVLNNPLRYTDPTGHVECEETTSGCHPPGSVSKGGGGTKLPTTPNPSPDERAEHGGGVRVPPVTLPAITPITNGTQPSLVDFLYDAAIFTQDVAFLIDIPFAITEGIFIAGGCIGEGLAGCAGGALLGWEAFNFSGANAAESALSSMSLALTVVADGLDGGGLGEASSTSFATFVVGGAISDPIGDVIVDWYASGYNHEAFNGIETLMNGGPFFISK